MDSIRTARAVPHVAVGTLVIAASAAQLAQTVTGEQASVAAWTAGTAFVVAVVAATIAHRRVFSRKSLRRVYAFLTVAVGWLTYVTVTDLTLGAVGVLMAIGYGLSMHWWRTNPLPMLADDIPQMTSEFVTLWQENISSADGCLPGTVLTGEEEIKAGVRFVLRLRPGKQTLTMVMGVLDKVRSGLRLRPGQDLIVEAHPTLDESSLLLTLVTRSPIKESVIHPGASAFDPKTGRIALGPFVDGEGTARWKAYTDNRLWGGFVQGGTGSGKSRLIESVALSLASATSHPTVIMYGDGQGGASSPLLMKHADVKARTHDQILAMAEGLHLVVLLRQDENAVEGLEGFTPTKDRPGILGIIDECHKPLNKMENPDNWERLQYLLATIAREGGKVGVALLLASQQATLDVFGGSSTSNNSEAIRTNILAGNGVMMRGKDPNARTIFGVDVNPKKFPALAGYGFLVDSDPNSRSAPFRGYYVTDDIRDEWPTQIDWVPLDPGAAAQWGDDYLRRDEIAKESLDAVRRRLAARKAGVVAEKKPSAPVVGQCPTTAPFPAWDKILYETQKANPNIHQGHDKILQAMEEGSGTPKTLMTATGYSDRQVANLLNDLITVGKVARVGHGKYQKAA